MELILRQFELPLAHPFGISRGTRTSIRTLIVELRDAGFSGFGEAVEDPYYGMTIERMAAALTAIRPFLSKTNFQEPESFWESVHPYLSEIPFAQCALDEAACDLWGKLQGKPCWQLWGLDPTDCPMSDYTIGIDSIDVMVRKLREFEGWPVYKIKLGTRQDIEIVRHLRRVTDARFRVDANCGWNADETIRNSHVLKELGVEFIEQPLPADAWEQMGRVRSESALPIMADESCRIESDVDHCAGLFDGINIKLTKCGGPTPARRMIARAVELDLKVMIGCMTESTVGISAIGQLLPLLDYVDMDGALLLARDLAEGVTIDRGRVVLPGGDGAGVELFDELQDEGIIDG
jgi:L-Ala-D/L-Glu epimerase / N-acetyl-D-glutamate racemase